MKALIEQDKEKTQHVIIIGKMYSDKAMEHLSNNCFHGSRFHPLGRECIGQGAYLRAIEIQQLFGSGIYIDEDIK